MVESTIQKVSLTVYMDRSQRVSACARQGKEMSDTFVSLPIKLKFIKSKGSYIIIYNTF